MNPKIPLYRSKPNANDRILRSIITGAILAVLNSFWVIYVGGLWLSGSGIHMSAMSIFFSAIFCLFFIILANLLLQRYLPRYAFSKGEILIIYVMMNMASGLAGHGFMPILGQTIAFPFWYATEENEWVNIIQPYIPTWISVRDMSALKGYYHGESSFYTIEHLRAWFIPIITWTCFIFAFASVMLFINIIVRRRWIEQEKLSYPIIQLPLEMIDHTKGFFKNRLLWCGFAIAGGIELINGLSFLFPVIPNIYVKMTNIGRYFDFKPFNVLGWFPIAFYPFIIGLGFLIPADLSFSFWFFYLAWKFQYVSFAALGSGHYHWFRSHEIYLAAGAFIGLCGVALWQTRRHLSEAFKSALGLKSKLDDTNEPVSYRTAFVGLSLSSLFLVGFCYMAGMSLWVIILFFLIYYALCIAITRMRAEMGVPVHDLHRGGPDIVLPNLLGTRALKAPNLTIMAHFYFFNRCHYSDIMPHQLEGFKVAEKIQSSNRRLMVSIFIGIFIGILGTFWAILHYGHKIGMQGHVEWFGYESFNRIQSWLTNPREPDYGVLGSLGLGVIIYVLLMVIRNRFIWWPLHPAGFAVSNSWGGNVTWFPVFIGWLIKTIILKWGGLKSHSKAIPFFLGLMLGDFVVGTFWSLWGAISGSPHYSLFPYGR